MSEETALTPEVIAELASLLGLDRTTSLSKLTELPLDKIQRRTRNELMESARLLSVTGVEDLGKKELAPRLHEALQRLQAPVRTVVATTAPSPGFDTAGGMAKYDVGHKDERTLPKHIPWGYGQDRVTAMVVDPEVMYVYWETTDDAIERARKALGPGGQTAWLNLRVYDISGRIFDGTNAHSYFDHKIERSDRHWFFHVNKPTSTMTVELGLKSFEGYFVKIVRSGRVEFPRREPAAPGPVEWLTVYTATGEVGPPTTMPALGGGWPQTTRHAEHVPEARGPGQQAEAAGRVWTQTGAQGESYEEHWVEWGELTQAEWRSFLRFAGWETGVERWEWESDTYTVPLSIPDVVEERDEGKTIVFTREGATRIVHGPWRVVIRGLNARGERRVLSTWSVQRSWIVAAGFERTGQQIRLVSRAAAGDGRFIPVGASEAMLIGASERRWIMGSEVRLGGASEVFRVGASEIRLQGASETLYQAASMYRFKGASEYRFRGASEWRFAGASERLTMGGSESRLGGASEAMIGGGSEQRLGGASEINWISEVQEQLRGGSNS